MLASIYLFTFIDEASYPDIGRLQKRLGLAALVLTQLQLATNELYLEILLLGLEFELVQLDPQLLLTQLRVEDVMLKVLDLVLVGMIRTLLNQCYNVVEGLISEVVGAHLKLHDLRHQPPLRQRMCHVQPVILLEVLLDSIVKPLLQLSLLLLKPRLLDLRVLQESFLSSLIRLGLRSVNLLQLAFLE